MLVRNGKAIRDTVVVVTIRVTIRRAINNGTDPNFDVPALQHGALLIIFQQAFLETFS